jgi:transposase-like protein
MFNGDFKSIIELVRVFKDEQTCTQHLEDLRWNGNVVSPFDADSKVYKCAGNKYKCKNTGKYFNVRTGTLFDNTKVDLQLWFMAIYLVTGHKKGISSLQLSRDLNVTQKTAWFMLQRIRNCFGIENDSNDLANEVEIDETYIGGKNKNRHFDKKIDYSTGKDEKTPVFGMVEREGKVVATVVPNTKAETLIPEIIERVKGHIIYSDQFSSYKSLQRIYDHSFVKHNEGQYVDGRIHTNTIEGFWSLLKRGIFGIYHFTSKKHLQYYVDEFVFRYNTRHNSDSNRFNLLLVNCNNRLKYNDLIK